MPKALCLLSALFLLILSAAAAAFGMANIYRQEALNLTSTWDGDDAPPAAAWEQAHRYLWLANRLAPLDGSIMSELAELFELRGEQAPAGERGSSADLERALGLYRQTLSLRPAWPYAWLAVVLVKHSQRHIDAEFALALQRALELGPWQSLVQASSASAGLAAWDKLPVTLQLDIEQAVARGLGSGSPFMPVVARHHGLIAADG